MTAAPRHRVGPVFMAIRRLYFHWPADGREPADAAGTELCLNPQDSIRLPAPLLNGHDPHRQGCILPRPDRSCAAAPGVVPAGRTPNGGGIVSVKAMQD